MRKITEIHKDSNLSSLILGFLGIVGLGLLAMTCASLLEAHTYNQQLGSAIKSYESAVTK